MNSMVERSRELHRRHRKVNDTPAAETAHRRRELARTECQRRGVRFLPAQCLRAALQGAGLL